MQKIISELKLSNKGFLELIVLKRLRKRPSSIVEIADELRQAGFNTPLGTLYPLFASLQKSALLRTDYEESDRGLGMKVYGLSQKGQQRLKELKSDWHRFSQLIAST